MSKACPCKLKAGDAHLIINLGVYVGCCKCGFVATILLADQHTVELPGGKLKTLLPGFTCASCRTRQAVANAQLEVA